jgi:hypothetical protein
VEAIVKAAEEARREADYRLPILIEGQDTGYFQISCPGGYLIGSTVDDTFIIVDYIDTLEIESYIRRLYDV